MFSTEIIILCSNNMRCYTGRGTPDEWLSILVTFREKEQKNYLLVKSGKEWSQIIKKKWFTKTDFVLFIFFKCFIFKEVVLKFSRQWITLAKKTTTVWTVSWREREKKTLPLEIINTFCSLHSWISDSNHCVCVLHSFHIDLVTGRKLAYVNNYNSKGLE